MKPGLLCTPHTAAHCSSPSSSFSSATVPQCPARKKLWKNSQLWRNLAGGAAGRFLWMPQVAPSRRASSVYLDILIKTPRYNHVCILCVYVYIYIYIYMCVLYVYTTIYICCICYIHTVLYPKNQHELMNLTSSFPQLSSDNSPTAVAHWSTSSLEPAMIWGDAKHQNGWDFPWIFCVCLF